MANAANKFFVVDLDHELTHGFYARIFAFQGDAPDQYRILPLLPLKVLCLYLPFNHAVLLYNCFFGWIVLELLWWLSDKRSLPWRLGLSFGFSILYVFTQYTGWRPDTLGLMTICLASACVLRDMRDAAIRWLFFACGIVALSFSRAEIALFYALFATFYRNKSYAALIPIPILAQVVLQEWIFPNAQYYSKVFMLWDNLRLHYLLHNPATYLIAAAVLAYWRPIRDFVMQTFRRNYYFYLILMGYVLLVALIGRLNEYRLYLPFVPLLLMIPHESKPAHGK